MDKYDLNTLDTPKKPVSDAFDLSKLDTQSANPVSANTYDITKLEAPKTYDLNALDDPNEIPGFSGHKAHPEVTKIAQEYYGIADPQEALKTWVSDQTWNNANAAMALIDAVKAQTADPLKAKQMAFLGEQFDKLPSFWEGDRPVTEKASRLWANVWRGIADPVTWAGGAVGGKIAATGIAKGAGLLTRVAGKNAPLVAKSIGAAALDVAAGGTAETAQQLNKVATGRQDEISVPEIAESAGLMGLTGGLIRGGAGLVKKGLQKAGILSRDPEKPILQDNVPTKEQLLATKNAPSEPVKDKFVLLTRTEEVPGIANENKFPEMERTTPIKDEIDSGILARSNDEEPTLFKDLEPLDNALDEPHVEPIKDNGLLQESEPKFGQDNLLEPKEPIEPIYKNTLPPPKSILERNNEHQNFDESLPKIKEDTIIKDDGTIKTTEPIIVSRKINDNIGVRYISITLDGKHWGMTFRNVPLEGMHEYMKAMDNIEGGLDARPQYTKQQLENIGKQITGDTGIKPLEALAKLTGVDVNDPKLSALTAAQLSDYRYQARDISDLARNLIEAKAKFGDESLEYAKAFVNYAQVSQVFEGNTKLFTGVKSELGRALSVLNPNSTESLEQQLMRLANESKEPPGIGDKNVAPLCGA